LFTFGALQSYHYGIDEVVDSETEEIVIIPRMSFQLNQSRVDKLKQSISTLD